MQDIINNFISNMETQGVSRNDIKTLEDTIGEPIITSNINIKHFTTERSSLPILHDVADVLNVYVKEYTDKSLSENYTNREIFDIYHNLINKLSDLTKTVKEISENITEDFFTNLTNSNYKYSFINYEGVKQEDVINVFDNKSNLLEFINNEELFYNLFKEENRKEFETFKVKKDYFIGDLITKGIDNNGNDISLFLFLNLIINKDVNNYFYKMSFTPIILNGNDLIKFLKDSYIHKEYLIELTNSMRSQFEYSFKNVSLNRPTYYELNAIKRMEEIIPNIKLVNEYLKLICKILQYV